MKFMFAFPKNWTIVYCASRIDWSFIKILDYWVTYQFLAQQYLTSKNNSLSLSLPIGSWIPIPLSLSLYSLSTLSLLPLSLLLSWVPHTPFLLVLILIVLSFSSTNSLSVFNTIPDNDIFIRYGWSHFPILLMVQWTTNLCRFSSLS